MSGASDFISSFSSPYQDSSFTQLSAPNFNTGDGSSAGYYTPNYTLAPNFGTMGTGQSYSPYSGATMGDSNVSVPQTFSGGYTPDTSVSAPASSGSWYTPLTSAISSQWQSDPLKVLGTLGMGGLNAIGSAMSAVQSNKLAKKMSAQNDKVMAFQQQQMDRLQANQAIQDKLNNSYDVTAPATVNYTPISASDALHYGQGGTQAQNYSVTPGATTRVQLATGGQVHGFASGGQADDVPAMLSEGEFVIPADVVSMLGDGSTKAGSSALTQMMHEIRSMSRSAPVNSIPKPVGSPLSILKKGAK